MTDLFPFIYSYTEPLLTNWCLNYTDFDETFISMIRPISAVISNWNR